MLERERTFLARELPGGLENSLSQEIVDIYIPSTAEHPDLRLRRQGETYEITRKHPADGSDSSQQTELTIPLRADEFEAFEKVEGKRVRKIRYYYQHGSHTAEFDLFCDDLNGLVLIDYEFDSVEELQAFVPPDFCLSEVTHEDFIAGGKLAGKRYVDIAGDLERLNYQALGYT